MGETSQSEDHRKTLDFLEYYCDPKSEFHYAVMVRGSWGAGKTHLINSFLEQRASRGSTKNLYVSLYGVNSFRQIDDSLYRQLHPVLSSKGMKIAANIGRQVIKAATRFDMNGDGKEDVTLNLSIPDIDLKEYFKTPAECLLIFDDLERCSMPIADVLGYINAFVEHEHFKAIIIANEDEILKKPDTGYAQIKEKLVGQTLSLKSAAALALNAFIAAIRDSKTQDFLRKNIQTIRQIYSQSGTDNLRILRHSLWDFERIAASFEQKHWANNEAVGSVLKIVLSLSFQSRSGKISESEMLDIPTESLRLLFSKKETDAAPTSIELLTSKYPDIDFTQTIVPLQIIKSLLFDGQFDSKELRDALNHSSYFASKEFVPPWKLVWRGLDLTDEDFDWALSRLEEQFLEREITERGELFHVFGIRLWCSRIGALKKTGTETEIECKRYIDDLRHSDSFPNTVAFNDYSFHGSYDSLGFHESDTPEFKAIVKYFYEVANKVQTSRLPAEANRLMSILRSDHQKYFQLLCLNNAGDSPFHDIPVLAHVPVNMFVDTILALPPVAQRAAFSTFRSRYEQNTLRGDLSSELPWLQLVKDEFRDRITKFQPISKHRIDSSIAYYIDPHLP